jgi:hypothetical protein
VAVWPLRAPLLGTHNGGTRLHLWPSRQQPAVADGSTALPPAQHSVLRAQACTCLHSLAWARLPSHLPRTTLQRPAPAVSGTCTCWQWYMRLTAEPLLCRLMHPTNMHRTLSDLL